MWERAVMHFGRKSNIPADVCKSGRHPPEGRQSGNGKWSIADKFVRKQNPAKARNWLPGSAVSARLGCGLGSAQLCVLFGLSLEILFRDLVGVRGQLHRSARFGSAWLGSRLGSARSRLGSAWLGLGRLGLGSAPLGSARLAFSRISAAPWSPKGPKNTKPYKTCRFFIFAYQI